MNISGVAGGNHDDECMKKPILGGDDIMALSLAGQKKKISQKCGGDHEHFKKYSVFEKR